MQSKWEEILSHGFGFWEVIGILGMLTFSSRFVIQWIVSEIKQESVIPVVFWYLSIVGSLLTLSYAVHIADPIFISMYLFNSVIYGRNLWFIHTKKRRDKVED